MDWSHPGDREAGGHHEPHAAPLRRHRPAAAEPHRRNGYRYYDDDALVRLQRILLLRELGLGLPAIAEVLDRAARRTARPAQPPRVAAPGAGPAGAADRVASSAPSTALEGGERLMAENMFDGFDHTQYKEEVEERWGKDAYAKSDAWWRSMSRRARRRPGSSAPRSSAATGSRRTSGASTPTSDEAQALAQRHFDWLRGIPGTPGGGAAGPTKEYFARPRRDVRGRRALRRELRRPGGRRVRARRDDASTPTATCSRAHRAESPAEV